VLKLDPGVLGREAPVDATPGLVARCLPGGDLPLQGCLVCQAAVQALFGEHGKLDLGHVQPIAMLGVYRRPHHQRPRRAGRDIPDIRVRKRYAGPQVAEERRGRNILD
jgi:hypothetical protein